MIEAALRAILTADVTLSPRVGPRVYPGLLPENPVYPAITYRQISGAQTKTYSGPIDPSKGRFQFDCFDDDYTLTKSLAAAVIAALDGYTGEVQQVRIGSLLHTTTIDIYDAVLARPKTSTDFMIIWSLTT